MFILSQKIIRLLEDPVELQPWTLKMAQQSPIPPPPKSRIKPHKSQNAPFSYSCCWGGGGVRKGGINSPSILSKIVAHTNIGDNLICKSCHAFCPDMFLDYFHLYMHSIVLCLSVQDVIVGPSRT